MKEIRNWRKVLENDLDYIVSEIKEMLERPAVIILSGPVGAGKTTFTKRFVGGVNNKVQSPTYSIINEVGGVAHADFYRLKDSEEIIHLEIPLYLEDKDYFLIEWGSPYLREIQREVGEEYFYYELEIEVNELANKEAVVSKSRNYSLKDISQFL